MAFGLPKTPPMKTEQVPPMNTTQTIEILKDRLAGYGSQESVFTNALLSAITLLETTAKDTEEAFYAGFWRGKEFAESDSTDLISLESMYRDYVSNLAAIAAQQEAQSV
jgi:hypothetical protein